MAILGLFGTILIDLQYSEGYSARGGQARSPYNLTVNPGGSSSGSAAAVAANQVMFALGTETDGR